MKSRTQRQKSTQRKTEAERHMKVQETQRMNMVRWADGEMKRSRNA